MKVKFFRTICDRFMGCLLKKCVCVGENDFLNFSFISEIRAFCFTAHSFAVTSNWRQIMMWTWWVDFGKNRWSSYISKKSLWINEIFVRGYSRLNRWSMSKPKVHWTVNFQQFSTTNRELNGSCIKYVQEKLPFLTFLFSPDLYEFFPC